MSKIQLKKLDFFYWVGRGLIHLNLGWIQSGVVETFSTVWRQKLCTVNERKENTGIKQIVNYFSQTEIRPQFLSGIHMKKKYC